MTISHPFTSLLLIFTLLVSPRVLAAPPANDHFASSQSLNPTGGVVQTNTTEATTEVGEPAHVNQGAYKTVWYQLTSTSSLRYTLDLAGSSFDTLLAVYTGNSLSSLTSVVSNDDNAGSFQSRLTLSAAAGVTYSIAVGGYDSSESGSAKLTWTPVLPPNDAFAGAQMISNRSGSFIGSNEGATGETGEPNAVRSVWYRWTAPASFPVYFKTQGSNFNTLLCVYSGAAPAQLNTLGCNDDGGPAGSTTSRLEFAAVADTVYMVQVSAANATAAGEIRLAWGEVGNENDSLLPDIYVLADESLDYLYGWTLDQAEIPGRTLLRLSTATPNIGAGPLELRGNSANPGVVQRIYHSDGAYHERLAGSFTFHPTHGHLHFDNWVQFHIRSVLPQNAVGPIVASGGKTSFAIIDLEQHDTSMPGAPQDSVYGGGMIQGLSVGWRDIYGASLDGQWIDVTSVPPGAYWLECIVDPDNHIEESDEGNNTTRILINYAGIAPANNNFATATLLAGRSVGTDGRTLAASHEIGEPNHAGQAGGGGSVWYRWVAPASGTTVMTTAGSDFDTLLAVYTGSSVGILTPVSSNDDQAGLTTSRLTFNAISGTSYRIAVDGKAGARGIVELAINPALNDHLAAATLVTGTTGTTRGSNRGATAESFEPTHAGSAARHSIWFSLTASLTGDATLNTLGSTADTRLAVYTGATMAALIPVAWDDNTGLNNTSQVTFRVTSGTIYRIAVDGDPGAIVLNHTLSTALAPTIITQPAGHNLVAGSSLTLQLAAVGSPTLIYEWRHAGVLLVNDARISGATTDTLTIAKVSSVHSGGYQCTVRNAAGSATSDFATIIVIENPRVVYVQHAPGDIGGTVRVPIMIQSQGNELGLQFSLNYNSQWLTQPSIKPGSGAMGGTLVVNSTLAASGKLGVSLTMPPGTLLAPGLREIAYLELQSAANIPDGSVTPIGFSSTPLPGRGFTANAGQLPIVLAAGNLTLRRVQENLGAAVMGNGSLALHLRGVAGKTYHFQTSSNLDGTWNTLQTVQLDHTGQATVSEPGGRELDRKFFRAQPQE